MSIAPSQTFGRAILALGGVVFAAALATIGVELLDVVGVAAVAVLLVGAVALRRWSG